MKQIVLSATLLLAIALPAFSVEFGGEVNVAKRNFQLIKKSYCKNSPDCQVSSVRVIGNWALIIWTEGDAGGNAILKYTGTHWAVITDGGGVMSADDAIQEGVPESVAKILVPVIFYFEPGERIQKEDLKELSAWDLLVARNTIYARHGRTFTYQPLAQYFSSFSWYHPNPNYADTLLSAIDRKNIATLLAFEKGH